MAKKDTNNFKGMKKDELEKELAVLRDSIRLIHFKAEGSKSKNVKEAGATKKQIDRILTEINHSSRA